jgi:RND family efflux transporter MFP subunit
MNIALQRGARAFVAVRSQLLIKWRMFRSLRPWKQAVGAVLVALVLIGFVFLFSSLSTPKTSTDQLRTVSLATAASLGGSTSGDSVLGLVRSVTEATLLAESGGTVRRVHTSLGARVPAGFVLAELDNASQRAAVLQAEGAYDAAVAARSAVSPADVTLSVRNTYRAAFAATDNALTSEVDSVFGDATAYGPELIISRGTYAVDYFPRERAKIETLMNTWRLHQATITSDAPETQLNEAQTVLETLSRFLAELTRTANEPNSNATATQRANLASARATVNAHLAAVAGAREAYRGKSVTSTASVDASVKQALGSLRGAQAQLEKTLVRAPISGTVNFLSIRQGDYVTAFTHVATVAQNGALEIVASVSEDARTSLSVGEKVQVEATYSGIITTIAPALDPSTRQIEIRIAVTDVSTTLVNGQSVRITLPGAPIVSDTTGPLLLPLASVKLLAQSREVFTVSEDGRLIGHAVAVGQVRGSRIEVLSGISPDTRIVTDARGLSAGQKVAVASTLTP